MRQKRRRTSQSHNRKIAPANRPVKSARSPFATHLYELRRRCYYIALSILGWGAVTYAFERQLVELLLRPSHGQHFIYTSPGGGIDFLFRVCVYGGIVGSIPVIVYNALRFLQPLLSITSNRFVIIGTFASASMAIIGIIFGYFIGLPAALHLLLNQFTTVQIRPLLTIQSYLSFVTVYMIGSAMLFQLPLLIILINRIKPLKPKTLFHYERWVILIAFIVASIMNPSPNLLSQLLIAGPFIIMYQIAIGMVAYINRDGVPDIVKRLRQQDETNQESRQSIVPKLEPFDHGSTLKLEPRQNTFDIEETQPL